MSKKKKAGAPAKAAPTDNPSTATGKVTKKPDTTEVSAKLQGKEGHVTQSRQPITSRQSIVRYNPYTIRRSSPPVTTRIENGIGQMLKIMTEYITIFIDHDANCTTELWYKTWTSWVELGLNNDKMTVQQIANIVSYPGKYKSVKEIGLYMIEKLPILARYIVIAKQTKDQEPLVHHSKT